MTKSHEFIGVLPPSGQYVNLLMKIFSFLCSILYIINCLSFFFWTLYCLSFDFLYVITPPLVSSNFSSCLLYTRIMVLYIYKYWIKMLKRWKFPPLIKAHASSANCTMGNLTCSLHATYLHTIYVKSQEIHILSTMQILVNGNMSLLRNTHTKQIWISV